MADAVGADNSVLNDVDANTFQSDLPAAGRPYGAAILQVAAEDGVDPYLLAAIMQQESGFGVYLSPRGPTGTGDGGHGRGLVQIDDRSHGPDTDGVGKGDGLLGQTLPDGTPKWQDPYWNLKFGVSIFKQGVKYLASTPKTPSVTVKPTDKLIIAAGAAPGTYADPRPLTGDDLRFAALAAYNTGAGNVLKALAAGLPADATTTKTKWPDGQVSYATSVLRRKDDLTA